MSDAERKSRIPEQLRRQMRERAQGRCEYCLLHDEDVYLRHQADHITAEKHGGSTTLDNLAWACFDCNHYMGTDLSSVDTLTGRIVLLFHPRRQKWHRHFHLIGSHIEPLTASGRATARICRFNDERHIQQRAILIAAGRYPRE